MLFSWLFLIGITLIGLEERAGVEILLRTRPEGRDNVFPSFIIVNAYVVKMMLGQKSEMRNIMVRNELYRQQRDDKTQRRADSFGTANLPIEVYCPKL